MATEQNRVAAAVTALAEEQRRASAEKERLATEQKRVSAAVTALAEEPAQSFSRERKIGR